MITNVTTAKYFPSIKWTSVMGRVSSSSMVPVRFSSENVRMAMAGTRNRNIHGAIMNSVSNVEYPPSNTLSSPGKTQMNKPFTTRNTMAAIRPVNEEKKLLSSLMKIAYILEKFDTKIVDFTERGCINVC